MTNISEYIYILDFNSVQQQPTNKNFLPFFALLILSIKLLLINVESCNYGVTSGFLEEWSMRISKAKLKFT